MTNAAPSFTPEQVETINQQINTALLAYTAQIETITGGFILENQDKIIKAAETRIAEAINRNQKVIIASEQSNSEKSANKDANAWKILIAVLPVILTAALGYWIWNLQKETEKKISAGNEELKTGLALKEEFYKSKLKTYENSHVLMYKLLESLQNAQVDPDSRSKAVESLRTMYQDYSSRSLYMSNEVIQELQKLWSLGTDLSPLRPNGKSTINQFVEQIGQVEKVMKDDLQVKEIGQFSGFVKKDQPKW